ATWLPLIRPDQVKFEEQMMQEVSENLAGSTNKRKNISEKLFKIAQDFEAAWLNKVDSTQSKHQNRLLYRSAWKKFNNEAKMNQ
ncbi:MAG: hypothetical protein Q7U31_07740, partial [Anaerolineaceae bacterium]|nr:hypothetical protein [Anaerolineaceae bacterium]